MTDPIHSELLRELVTIQRARALNWRNPISPLDARLEESHAARLAAIKKQLSAHGNNAVGTSDAPLAAVSSGGFPAAAGIILSRIIRRFRKAKH